MCLAVLKKRVEFTVVSKYGKIIFSDSFVLQFVSRDKLPFQYSNEIKAYGITVSRKVGCSVVRNRVRRIFKSLVREFSDLMRNDLCYVFIGKRSMYYSGFIGLKNEFAKCINKANKKYK